MAQLDTLVPPARWRAVLRKGHILLGLSPPFNLRVIDDERAWQTAELDFVRNNLPSVKYAVDFLFANPEHTQRQCACWYQHHYCALFDRPPSCFDLVCQWCLSLEKPEDRHYDVVRKKVRVYLDADYTYLCRAQVGRDAFDPADPKDDNAFAAHAQPSANRAS